MATASPPNGNTCDVANVCGTGQWSGPKPGDPNMGSGDIRLSATAIVGGISVTWNYPGVNAHAVAHVNVYRATNSDFSSAIHIATVNGSQHIDRMETVNTYWYWIKMVSINGTEGSLIGPASATSRNFSEDLINGLPPGVIGPTLLDPILQEPIARITQNYDELRQEISDRINGNAALSAAISQIQNGLAEAVAVIDTETVQRIDGQNVLASQIETIGALNAENAAAIINEATARVSADEATANQVNAVMALTSDNAAAIVNEANVRATQDSALANQISTLSVATGQNAAAIQQEALTRASADGALSQQITTVQSEMNGQLSSVQVTLSTAQGKIADHDNKLAGLGAAYVVKLNHNGLASGFGLYNTGVTSVAQFDVNEFYIGSVGGSSGNVMRPFSVVGNTVYINRAVIRDGMVDTLSIGRNAVTIPYFLSAGDRTIAANGTSVVFDTNVNLGPDVPGGAFGGGGPSGCTMVQFSFFMRSTNDGWGVATIYLDGNEPGRSVQFGLRVSGGGDTDMCMPVTHTAMFPGIFGSHRISCRVTSIPNGAGDYHPFSVMNASLSIFGGKR